MVGVTKGLKRALLIVTLIYLAAGCAAVAVSSFFLATPFKRRQIVISTAEILTAMSIGGIMIFSSFFVLLILLSTNLRQLALRIFNILVFLVLVTTLCLGAYVWFQSLDIKNSYYDRWITWNDITKDLFQSTGNCCGYKSGSDNPAISDTCTESTISNELVEGCSASIYTFVNGYLSNIYSILFAYAAVDFAALLMSLVALEALKEQSRYEKSMRKMINLHHLDNSHLLQSETNENYDIAEDAGLIDPYHPNHHITNSHLPSPNHRASVIYNYSKVA